MASQGAIAAAVIGAVGAVAAAVLAVVLPNVLNNPSTESGSTSPTIANQTQGGNTGTRVVPRTTTTTTTRVEAQVFPNKEAAPVGATVQVGGKGFDGGETIEIRFGAQTAATTQAAKAGEFANVSVKVPEFFRDFDKPMPVEIVATGRSSVKSARAAFTISG
jgi:hypothetical protein